MGEIPKSKSNRKSTENIKGILFLYPGLADIIPDAPSGPEDQKKTVPMPNHGRIPATV
jgi:hypothetical protein